ncbi:acyl-CoA thioesterase [Neobacillus cucumis]|uniref:acyl-CoA thioesterase n=1 Tax=Neobacillus cucumis TaxID=1740721 RepID=UPI0018DF0609|nr:acyl-CoA thioesterase [Neobacillus cucumis]MBI0577007.1 acyl-CoA thioesterase [Neobacillus cucumis]WHY94005.1 acyl-CoA thioesterase [Neobacillus cucumis]
METKYCKESRVIRTSRVFPNDVNNHNTLFGGQLMSHLDQVASTSAARHSRRECVTASTDTVDFLHPIQTTDSVCFESYVTWTGTSSMEVFVKIIAEDLKSGECKIAATAFLTFVALDQNKRPTPVPRVIPETEEEKRLHETAMERARIRKDRKQKSKELEAFLTINYPSVQYSL